MKTLIAMTLLSFAATTIKDDLKVGFESYN